MDEDLTLDSAPKTQPKKGRRAKVLLNKSKEVLNEKKDDSNSSGVSSRPSRRQMGWDKNSNTSVNEPIDARLIPDNNSPIDDDEAHIIPDLAEIHEDTMAQEVAAPPSLFTSNIASYKLVFRLICCFFLNKSLDNQIFAVNFYNRSVCSFSKITLRKVRPIKI